MSLSLIPVLLLSATGLGFAILVLHGEKSNLGVASDFNCFSLHKLFAFKLLSRRNALVFDFGSLNRFSF